MQDRAVKMISNHARHVIVSACHVTKIIMQLEVILITTPEDLDLE